MYAIDRFLLYLSWHNKKMLERFVTYKKIFQLCQVPVDIAWQKEKF